VTLVVRRMRWWDIEPVLRLESELFGREAWSAAMYWSELAEFTSRHYLVAEDDGLITGYAGLAVFDDEASVQTIGVAPGRQRQGLGAELLTGLLREAARRGARSMSLEVRADNEPAQALYRRFGFSVVGRRTAYYQPSGVDALVMRARLP
jgi:[ribosomal protein S18]-alanine N-acetyltransferase